MKRSVTNTQMEATGMGDVGPVLIVYAGGTFGMKDFGHGLEAVPELREEVAALVAESDLTRGVSTDWDYVVPAQIIDSAEAGQSTAAELARLVRDRCALRTYRGVVVIHGTDTLAFTAARLAFSLADLAVPVVVTGSQLPLGAVDTDAVQNFCDAFVLVSEGSSRGCTVVFGGKRLPAVRATKGSSEDLVAFVAHRELGENPSGVPAELAQRAAAGGSAPPAASVGLVKLFPGFSAAILEAALLAYPGGLVLECYGAGTAPIRTLGFLDAIRAAVARGTVVIAVTQCETGSVQLGRYAVGDELAAAGALGGLDLTVEAALAKLGVLLDAGCTPAELHDLMRRNLIGECTV